MEQLLDLGSTAVRCLIILTSNKLINKSASKTAISQITLGSIETTLYSGAGAVSNVGISNVR
jgi:hypothetical protein